LRNEQARREIDNVYELHRTIMSAFPDRKDGGPGRVLFRVEERSENPEGKAILVQSSHSPDWEKIDRPLGYFLIPPEHKEFDPIFVVGQILSFRLMANPTVKRDGKRLGLLKDEEQIDWINRKAERNGFFPIKVINIPKEDRNGRKPGQESPLTFHAVLYEGTLRVDDPVRFKNALESGIGSAKGFGLGLLSVAKVRSDEQGLS
jgi:CRISPR system Cascade subunit CasE